MIDQSTKNLRIFDLEFSSRFYYIQKESIAEQIKFNNRTFYSRFKKIERFNTSLLVQQHLNREIVVGAPLLTEERVDYILLEYIDDGQLIFLIKHILKLMEIDSYQIYRGVKDVIQTFISTKDLEFDEVYYLVDGINQFLVERNVHKCRVFPNKNLPKEYNIVNLPLERFRSDFNDR